MYRELRAGGHEEAEGAESLSETQESEAPRKTMRQAITQILVADISMSLDNVLAVAGAAKDHTWVLVVGLAISVVLMGVAATLIANLLNKYRWIAWVGFLLILYVAGAMIWDGTHEVAEKVPEAYAYLFLPLGFLALPGVFPVWLWVGVTFLQLIVYTGIAAFVADVVRQARREGGGQRSRRLVDGRRQELGGG
jgi:predicted tellurium resistance membrane protein TerC